MNLQHNHLNLFVKKEKLKESLMIAKVTEGYICSKDE